VRERLVEMLLCDTGVSVLPDGKMSFSNTVAIWAWYLRLYCLSASFQRMCCHSAVEKPCAQSFTRTSDCSCHRALCEHVVAQKVSNMWLHLFQWFSDESRHLLHKRALLRQCCFVAQMAGNVATQLWEEWQSDDVQADVFNVNVPLGFKTVDGTPVKPEVLHTTVDMQSQYSSLYSKFLACNHPGSKVLSCLRHASLVESTASNL